MRTFAVRLLTNAVPTMLLLAVCGYLAAHWTGSFASNERDPGEQLTETLAWRLPFTLAAWGGSFIVLYEIARAIWGKKPAAEAEPERRDDEAEALLNQLLAEADAAEEARRNGIPCNAQTPAPVVAGEPAVQTAATLIR